MKTKCNFQGFLVLCLILIGLESCSLPSLDRTALDISTLNLILGNRGGFNSSQDSESEDVSTVPLLDSGEAYWARTVTGGQGNSRFNDIAVDSEGNVFVVGFITGNGTFDFGNGVTITGLGPNPNDRTVPILVKYNPLGEAQWGRTIDGGTTGYLSNSANNGPRFDGIAIDPSGDIIVVGGVHGSNGSTTNFGNSVSVQSNSSSSASKTPVVVKYNSDGVAQWASFPTGISGTSIRAEFKKVKLDSEGNIVIIGFAGNANQLDFGNGQTASGADPSNPDRLIVKYNGSGVAQWARTMVASNPNNNLEDLDLSSTDEIFTAGSFFGHTLFDFGDGISINVAAPLHTGANAYMFRSASNGTSLQITTPINPDSTTRFFSIKNTDNDDFLVVGLTVGDSDYGGVDASCNILGASSKSMLLKYNTSGVCQWGRTVVGPSISNYSSVTSDASGNIFACGTQRADGEFDYGGGVIAQGVATGTLNNMSLVKYDSEGTAIWANSILNVDSGTTNRNECLRVATHSDNAVYMIGVQQSDHVYTYDEGVTAQSDWDGDSNAVILKYQQ
ncbi:MAG: hypothetical protein JJT78_04420 [Leptospira sp.]|nr:hypothetical protein [Leptospira sp.]